MKLALFALAFTALIWCVAILAYDIGIVEGRHRAGMEQNAANVMRGGKGSALR